MYIDADTEIRSKESIMAHKGFLYIEPDNSPDKHSLSLTVGFLKNIEGLGFTLDKKTIETLSQCSSIQISELYEEVYSVLEHAKGADVEHHIMYPNFPDQVMEMDEAELYFNAFIHYLSGGELVPEYEKHYEEFQKETNIKMTTLSSVNEEEFNERLMASLCSSTSITEREKEDLKWYFQNCDYKPYLPEEIPFKENAILAANELTKQGEKAKIVSRYIKTPTDVLRFATALSDGDVSLSKFTGFKNFSKPEQRMLLGLLEKTGKNPYELLRHREEFLLLGGKLHTDTEKNARLYPKTHYNFKDLQNETIFDVGSLLHEAIKEGDWRNAVNLLTTKNPEGIPTYNPGDFATKLDKIIRMTPDEHKIEVLEAFKEVSSDVKPPTLLRALANFEQRLDPNKEGRCIIPKGNINKTTYLEDTRQEILPFHSKLAKEILTDAIKEKFAEKSPMGNVYIDESIKGYNTPATSRSASDGFHTMERGSSVQIDNMGNYVVPFIHWKEKQGDRLDVDLSVVYYDKDMNMVDNIAFYNLKNEYTAHSGDLVSAKDGASEYICIDLDKVPSNVKYAAVNVHSYSGQYFSEIGECFVGVQHKEYKPRQEFDGSATRMKIDLTGHGQDNVPVMIDLKEGKMIWVDMPGIAPNDNYNTSYATRNDTLSKIKAIMNKPAISLEELATINAEARGKIVDSPEDAHIIITEDISKFDDLELREDVVVITPFDRDVINTQLLGEKNIAILPDSVDLEAEEAEKQTTGMEF